jgi:hypothetical protein
MWVKDPLEVSFSHMAVVAAETNTTVFRAWNKGFKKFGCRGNAFKSILRILSV